MKRTFLSLTRSKERPHAEQYIPLKLRVSWGELTSKCTFSKQLKNCADN
jgi:hypothetical protein